MRASTAGKAYSAKPEVFITINCINNLQNFSEELPPVRVRTNLLMEVPVYDTWLKNVSEP